MPKSTGEARDRTRTDDPVLTKDVLYRLSYPGAERKTALTPPRTQQKLERETGFEPATFSLEG